MSKIFGKIASKITGSKVKPKEERPTVATPTVSSEDGVSFTSGGVTNLYSKNHLEPKYLQTLYNELEPNLSLGDAKHDFGYTDAKMSDAKFQNGFNYGIPNPTTQIFNEDEGFINGEWKKGETTARNEKRFVTEMQQRKIDYKEDGLNKILEVLDVDNVDDTLYPNTKFINVKMK